MKIFTLHMHDGNEDQGSVEFTGAHLPPLVKRESPEGPDNDTYYVINPASITGDSADYHSVECVEILE